jgi:Zn-dependent oligopeptidase
MSKFNFSVKANPKNKDVQSENMKMIKRFMRKYKNSGIQMELRKKSYPITRGQKRRMKIAAGKKRMHRRLKKS